MDWLKRFWFERHDSCTCCWKEALFVEMTHTCCTEFNVETLTDLRGGQE